MYSPLFYAYFLVGLEESILWVQDGTLSEGAAAALEEQGVRVSPYEAVWEEIKGKEVSFDTLRSLVRPVAHWH